jgi:hypothetical protein
MAAAASTISPLPNSLAWLRDLLREELSPYPGRGALVARMVSAASIVMVINMTFQIPFGVYGAVYALILSREHPGATLQATKNLIVSFSTTRQRLISATWLSSPFPSGIVGFPRNKRSFKPCGRLEQLPSLPSSPQ